MVLDTKTHRRGFLGRVLGTAAALTAASGEQRAEAQPGGPDDWIKNVKGTHRCLFDFPQHKNGLPLLHILNYLNTYSEAYKTTPGQVGAVGTFYGIGGQSSIPLAFNDAMWAKYDLGAYTGLKDGSGKPHAECLEQADTRRSESPDGGVSVAADSDARRCAARSWH